MALLPAAVLCCYHFIICIVVMTTSANIQQYTRRLTKMMAQNKTSQRRTSSTRASIHTHTKPMEMSRKIIRLMRARLRLRRRSGIRHDGTTETERKSVRGRTTLAAAAVAHTGNAESATGNQSADLRGCHHTLAAQRNEASRVARVPVSESSCMRFLRNARTHARAHACWLRITCFSINTYPAEETRGAVLSELWVACGREKIYHTHTTK